MPARTTLPAALRDFIAQRIQSTDDLRVLLRVRRSPQAWWSAQQVAESLGLDGDRALAALERLAGGFLEVRVVSVVSFRFAPTHPERDRLTRDLAAAYETDPDAVTRLIVRESRRVIEDFAAAFKLRREE